MAAVLLFALSYIFVARAGISPFVANTLAYGVAFVCAYFAQRGWTFGASHSHGHALPRYLATQLVCALLAGVVFPPRGSWRQCDADIHVGGVDGDQQRGELPAHLAMGVSASGRKGRLMPIDPALFTLCCAPSGYFNYSNREIAHVVEPDSAERI